MAALVLVGAGFCLYSLLPAAAPAARGKLDTPEKSSRAEAGGEQASAFAAPGTMMYLGLGGASDPASPLWSPTLPIADLPVSTIRV